MPQPSDNLKTHHVLHCDVRTGHAPLFKSGESKLITALEAFEAQSEFVLLLIFMKWRVFAPRCVCATNTHATAQTQVNARGP